MDLTALTAAPFASDDDVVRVLDAFAGSTLPRAAWNHRAHLTVALDLARRHPSDTLLEITRREIHRFNDAIGIVSTPEYGYHETLTALYTQFVLVHVARHPSPTSRATDANVLYDTWGDRELPLVYYSRAVLFSTEARARFTPPDLGPLPTA